MTDYHSKPSEQVLKAIENFYTKWDYQVESLDDEENRKYFVDVLTAFEVQFSRINELWISKCSSDIDKLNKLLKTQDFERNQKYKDLAIDLNYKVRHLFELKNRRTKEIFDLRAENAKLKMELEQLKRNNNG